MAFNWDDEEREETSRPGSPIAYVPPSKQFDDEDEDGGEDDILDDWENESDVEREKAAKAQAAKEAEERALKAAQEAKANKLSRTERMKQNSALNEQLKLAQKEAAEASDDEPMDLAELRRREKESDLAHADDLFGDLGGPAKPKAAKKPTIVSLAPGAGKAAAPGGATSNDDSLDLASLPIFAPKTKADFATLQSVLLPLLSSNSSKKEYATFLQELTRELAKPLSSEQVRKMVSSLTTLTNEKMKEEKGPVKKSKAAKTKVNLNSGGRNPTGATAKIRDDEFADDGDDDYFM